MSNLQTPEGARRFTEAHGAAFELARTMNAWKNVVMDYEKQSEVAAVADVNYTDERRNWVKREQMKDPKLSSAKANDWADAEETIQQARLEHLLEDARLDSMKKKLDWFKAEVERLRTLTVDEREERKRDAFTQPG
jgi:hypothetical protein